MFSNRLAARLMLCTLFVLMLPACTAVMVTGAVVGSAASLAVEVVELPFEAAGAAYDLVTDDDEDNENQDR